MSKFIQTLEMVEAPPIFEMQNKEIIKPVRQQLTPTIGKGLKKRKERKTDMSYGLMEDIFKKLVEKQREQVVAENAKKIKESYFNLKHKWSKSCEHYEMLNDQNRMKNGMINNFFKTGRKRLDLKTVHEQMPKKVNLIKNYNSKIAICYGSIHQVNEIKKNKEKYVQWMNNSKNHITKSPIYQKMSKIIELKDKVSDIENGKKRGNGGSKTSYMKRKKIGNQVLVKYKTNRMV